MRIGIFTDDYLPNINGVITSIQNYRKALEQLGHEVWVIAPKFKDYVDEETNIIRLSSIASPVPMKLIEGRRGAILRPGLERSFDKYHFDVIHTQTEFFVGILGHRVAKRQKIPHVATIHTLYAEFIYDYPRDVFIYTLANSVITPLNLRKMPVNILKRDLVSLDKEKRADFIKDRNWQTTKLFLDDSSHVITPSAHLRKKLRKKGLIPPCSVLPNGITTGYFQVDHGSKLPFRREEGDFWIATFGRISGEKRQCVLLNALSELPANFKAVIAGPGPELETLREEAANLGLADRVVFPGFYTREEAADILQNVDAFAMTSYRFDNQPMVILEAISAGLPIIYCDDDLKEGLTEKNAILTDGIEGVDFAAAIKKLADDPELKSAMGAASKELSEDFDSVKLAKKLIRIYKKAPPLSTSKQTDNSED